MNVHRKIIILVLGSILFFSPTTARAEFGSATASAAIGCASGVLAGLAGQGLSLLSLTTVPTSNSTLEMVETCANSIAYSIAKESLKSLTDSTVNWVNTGFAGNPLYTRDMESYLRTISDEKLKTYIDNSQKTNPIFGNALRSTITQQVTGKSDGQINKQQNTPQAKAYSEFMGDFTRGGWGAFLNATQNDDNNPIGAFFKSTDEISKSINTAQQNTKDELARNNGFLDMKKCVEWAPQQTVDSMDDLDITDERCAKWETVTPGSLIMDQVANITNTTTRQLEQADELNEVLAAFFERLINNFFNKGLAGLGRGGNEYATAGGGPGSNVVLDSNGNMIGAGGFSSIGFDPEKFDITRPQQLRAVVQTQYDFISKIRDTKQAVRRIVPRLGQLDYCVPGPNITWKTGLDGNYDAVKNAIRDGSVGLGGFKLKWYTLNHKDGNPIGYDPITISITNVAWLTTPAVLEKIKAIFSQYYTYESTGLSDAFASTATTEADKEFARGFVTDATAQTQGIVKFSTTSQQLQDDYDGYITSTQSAIAELESIRREVNQIVGTAKTRYIAEQRALNTPVDVESVYINKATGQLADATTSTANKVKMSCIDYAYQINTAPIVATPRLEPNGEDPVSIYSLSSGDYFYQTLSGIRNL